MWESWQPFKTQEIKIRWHNFRTLSEFSPGKHLKTTRKTRTCKMQDVPDHFEASFGNNN